MRGMISAIPDTATVIARMQDAVDVVLESEHATSKVAACAFHPDLPNIPAASSMNVRPEGLKAHFDWDARIGSSSQFVHAEMAALMKFGGPIKGAHICVTDPFCPNCAKNLAEAGVRTIYIDHKGFQKDFIARNGDEFAQMSMLIAEKAGITVYEVNRKAGTVQPLTHRQVPTRPGISAIEFFDVPDEMDLVDATRAFRERLGPRETWAMAFTQDAEATPRGLLVFEALPPGFTPVDYRARAEPEGKYRFPLDPLTRLGIALRRMEVGLYDPRVACSHVPSSRALVNAMGLGISSLLLASGLPDHDASGAVALETLKAKGILTVTEI